MLLTQIIDMAKRRRQLHCQQQQQDVIKVTVQLIKLATRGKVRYLYHRTLSVYLH